MHPNFPSVSQNAISLDCKCQTNAVILAFCSCSRYPITLLVSTSQTITSPYNELAAIRLPHSENLHILSSYKSEKRTIMCAVDCYHDKRNLCQLTVFKLEHFSLYNSFQDDLSTTTTSLLNGYARQLPSVHLKEGVQYNFAVKKELDFGTTLFQVCIARFSLIFQTRMDPSALEDA